MVRRGHDDIGVGRERLGDGVHALGRAHHDGEVGQVAGQLVQQFLTIVHREIERHAIMPIHEFGQQAGKEIIAGADHRHVEPASGNTLELRHRVLGLRGIAG